MSLICRSWRRTTAANDQSKTQIAKQKLEEFTSAIAGFTDETYAVRMGSAYALAEIAVRDPDRLPIVRSILTNALLDKGLIADQYLSQTLAPFQINELKEAGLYKKERIITTPQSAVIKTTEGKEVLNFCANNYLGLSSHPDIIQAEKTRLKYYLKTSRQ